MKQRMHPEHKRARPMPSLSPPHIQGTSYRETWMVSQWSTSLYFLTRQLPSGCWRAWLNNQTSMSCLCACMCVYLEERVCAHASSCLCLGRDEMTVTPNYLTDVLQSFSRTPNLKGELKRSSLQHYNLHSSNILIPISVGQTLFISLCFSLSWTHL